MSDSTSKPVIGFIGVGFMGQRHQHGRRSGKGGEIAQICGKRIVRVLTQTQKVFYAENGYGHVYKLHLI